MGNVVATYQAEMRSIKCMGQKATCAQREKECSQ